MQIFFQLFYSVPVFGTLGTRGNVNPNTAFMVRLIFYVMNKWIQKHAMRGFLFLKQGGWFGRRKNRWVKVKSPCSEFHSGTLFENVRKVRRFWVTHWVSRTAPCFNFPFFSPHFEHFFVVSGLQIIDTVYTMSWRYWCQKKWMQEL